jgi:hypothetical protein
MPRAIHALRSYPIAVLLALLLFACSFVIATNSVGVIRGGGDDQGSGMGGTGKSGTYGDSGFGGTGNPSPFWGSLGEPETDDSASADPSDQNSWPSPWLPRASETAIIPAQLEPLIELQRNPLQDPLHRSQSPAEGSETRLIIQDPADSQLTPHARRILELANAQNDEAVQASYEIILTIPVLATELAEMPAPYELLQNPAENLPLPTQPAVEESLQPAMEAQQLADTVLPEQDVDPASAENSASEETADRRLSPERIQRPELPPFQRIRPAVDRASIVPARPQPMRI